MSLKVIFGSRKVEEEENSNQAPLCPNEIDGYTTTFDNHLLFNITPIQESQNFVKHKLSRISHALLLPGTCLQRRSLCGPCANRKMQSFRGWSIVISRKMRALYAILRLALKSVCKCPESNMKLHHFLRETASHRWRRQSLLFAHKSCRTTGRPSHAVNMSGAATPI
jgi:hypothetical protein